MKLYQIFLILAFCLVFGTSESFAQCGADGMQACSSRKSTKKVTKTVSGSTIAGKTNKTSSRRQRTITKDDDYYFNYAFKTCGEKDYDCKITNYTKSIQLGAGDGAYNNRGVAYKAKGQLDSAFSDFSKAIELNPSFALAYANRAILHSNRKNYDQAISDYTKAIEFKPDYAMAYNNRGWAYYLKGDYDKALTDADISLKLQPDNADTLDTRGNAYFGKGRYSLALIDFNRAVELDPTNPLRYETRAKAYRKIGEVSLAEADEKKAKELENK